MDNDISTTNNLFEDFVFNTKDKDLGMSFGNDYKIEPHEKNILSGLKKMNIFVGANNSGKSRILRSIFRQKDFMFLSLTKPFLSFVDELRVIFESSRFARGQMSKADQFLTECNGLKSSEFWVFQGVDTSPNIQNIKNSMNNVCHEIRNYLNQNNKFFAMNGEASIPVNLIDHLNLNESLITKIGNLPQVSKIYIPTLRGMRTIGDVDSDPYGDRTMKDYFRKIKEEDDQKVSSGLRIYQNIRSKLLGNQKDRKFIRNFEQFLTKNFFDNKNITLVPREFDGSGNKNDVVHITFEDNHEKERAIFEFGDGLQSIICITYPIFSWLDSHGKKENDHLFICIEEPELYLHPSMQRKLVEVLMSREFRNVQYFVTTHSNHFLDLFNEMKYKNDISVYSVSMDDSGVKNVRREIDLSDPIYDLLGAKPSSMLLANKTIWVEGVTDRMYIKHGIKLFFDKDNVDIKKPSEDLDYAFIEYGGSNLSHYMEDAEDLKIDSICNCRNVFMLVDDDSVVVGDKKFDRYESVKNMVEGFGGVFEKTIGREIENFIKPEVLKTVYTNLSDKLTHDVYLNKSLPKYLKSRGCDTYISGNKFYDKAIFAEKIIEKQKGWDDLSLEMQELIGKILKFVS